MPVSAPRRQNARGEGARLRDDLLDAAATLIGTSGSDADLSLRAVARSAGVSAQAVYLHFASLEELVVALIVDGSQQMGAALQQAALSRTDPVERILARGRAYLAWAAEHPARYQAMFEGKVQRYRDPNHTGRLLLNALRDDIVAAMASGAVPADDADLIAVELWALVHGLASLSANKPTFPWPDLVTLADRAGRRILGAGR